MIHIQNSNTWKPQLTIAINFISTEGVDEELVMHWKSNNIDFFCRMIMQRKLLIKF